MPDKIAGLKGMNAEIETIVREILDTGRSGAYEDLLFHRSGG